MSTKINKVLKLTVFFIICANILEVKSSLVRDEDSLSLGQGSLIYAYKQDPTTYDPTAYNSSSFLPSSILFPSSKQPFIKQVFIPRALKNGPNDGEITISDSSVKASSDDNGNFLSYKEGTPQFDAAHTYARVRETCDMWHATIKAVVLEYKDPKASKTLKKWNDKTYGPLIIYTDAGTDTNAYYSRTKTGGELKFFKFLSQEKKASSKKLIYTCRSSDIVAHETGHGALDRIRPDYWDADTLQTGGLHESFGDLSALFFIMTQDDMVESLVTSTKGDLHKQNFASSMAEEFGMGLGLPSSLRNADANYKIDEVDPEVHAVAEVFTGAIYDSLVSGFNDAYKDNHGRRRMTQLLQDTSDFLRTLILHAIIENETSSPTFKNIAEEMMSLADLYAKDSSSYLKNYNWKQYFYDEFSRRGIFIDFPSEKLKVAQDKKYGICGTHYHKAIKGKKEQD